MKLYFGIATTVGTVLSLSLAANAQDSTSFDVRIQIDDECVITSASDLDFGTGTLLTSAIDQVSTISVHCTNGTGYTVALDAGTGTGATVAKRYMTHESTTETIAYTLYRDSARTQVWGTTSGELVSGTGTGQSVAHTVYGRVFAASTAPSPGLYTDTITVTVTY